MAAVNAADPPGWNDPPDELDEQILYGVSEVWSEVDPPPAFLVDQVRFALDVEDADTEMLQLLEAGQLVGTRGNDQTRRITFGGDEVTVMIGIESNVDGTLRLDGWLAPAGCYDVEFRASDVVTTTRSDDDGRFVLGRVPTGFARLVLRRFGQPGVTKVVTTPSVEL